MKNEEPTIIPGAKKHVRLRDVHPVWAKSTKSATAVVYTKNEMVDCWLPRVFTSNSQGFFAVRQESQLRVVYRT